jgi:hypothetical protein
MCVEERRKNKTLASSEVPKVATRATASNVARRKKKEEDPVKCLHLGASSS